MAAGKLTLAVTLSVHHKLQSYFAAYAVRWEHYKNIKKRISLGVTVAVVRC